MRGDGGDRPVSAGARTPRSAAARRPGSSSPPPSAIVLAVGFDLSSIASIGSAIALLVFALVTAGHLRVRSETGASTGLLLLAIGTTTIVLLTFTFTTLVDEPATAVTIVAILLLSVVLDFAWKRSRDGAFG